ncbi:MAG TPA: hypothetical protein P5531_03995 [Bacteroidales bacterium]|nr:hypothetical protein [Bacteroidales bacterium]
MSLFTYGVTSIKVAAILGDGGIGTSFAALGKTLEGSCKIYHDDPTTTEFRSEENDTPEVSIDEAGNLNVEFTIMDPDADTLAAVFGGTSTGSPKVYTPPSTFSIVEKSIEITPREGMIFTATRVKMIAKINAEMSKKNIFGVDIKGIVLQPEKVGEDAFAFTEQA